MNNLFKHSDAMLILRLKFSKMPTEKIHSNGTFCVTDFSDHKMWKNAVESKREKNTAVKLLKKHTDIIILNDAVLLCLLKALLI